MVFDEGRIETFDREDVSYLRRIFLVEEISKLLAVTWDSLVSPGFPIKIKVKRGREQSTLGAGNKATSKEGIFLVKRELHGV